MSGGLNLPFGVSFFRDHLTVIFSQLYRAESGQVIYHGRQRERCGDAVPSPARIFPALDFLAALCTHIPDTGQRKGFIMHTLLCH